MSIKDEKIAEVKHILGIDFGTAKVGLSLADTETRLAFAYAVLQNDKDLFSDLKKIIATEDVVQIVIGKPSYALQVDGTDDKQVFGDELRKRFGVEVFFAEEMFTTQSAHANLHAAGKKNVAKNDDAESARIILQEWLDKNS